METTVQNNSAGAPVAAAPVETLPTRNVYATLEMARKLSDSNRTPIGGYVLKFSEPVCFRMQGRYYRDVRKFRFSKILWENETLYFGVSRRARWFHELPYGVERKIVGIEVAPYKDTFASFEQFASRFDRRFVSEEKLRELWNGTSGQHGGKYRPSDFRSIGPRGREVVQNFLRNFVDLNGGPAYNADGYLTVRYRSNHHSGRDITVSHLRGNGLVWYASEFHQCGNGRYGILVNERTFMHLEDD